MNLHPHNNQKPDRGDDDLRQLLLELHYELLDDDQAEVLRSRIQAEPEVARQWAETLVVAGKLAEAAKVRPEVTGDSQVATAVAADSTHRAFQPATGRDPVTAPVSEPSRGTGRSSGDDLRNDRYLRYWIVSLATAATIAIAVCSVRYFNALPVKPSADLYVAVQLVAGEEATSRNEFFVVVRPVDTQLSAFDASAPIVPATISFQVISKGVTLFLGKAETSASDVCRITIPDEVTIPGDAVLQVDANPIDGKETVRMSVPLEPTRCLTFVSTDRPVYRPGETVFYRSVTLNRRTLAAHLDVPIRYELVDASGSIVDEAAIEGVTERGVGNGAFVIPESAPGGTYQLIARSLDGFFPDQSLDLEVRRYRAVRLKTDLEFEKRSYGVDALVEATLKVRRADDSIPVAAAARISAVVDGTIVHQSESSIDLDGTLKVAFRLPSTIRQGNGTLAIAIDDGSVTETAVRTIPIHLGRANVEFFPEGGYLVGGIDNRVYFSARNADGEPIDIEGEILSQAGRMVAQVKTVRDGMGRFEFKPESGQRYSLRVTSPMDITETPWLPSVVEALPVIDTGLGVFDSGEPIRLTIRSTKRRKCLVRAVCRGELVGVKVVDVGLGETAVNVPIQDRTAGVVRVTVLDAETETAVPLVERLVYRRGSRSLTVTAKVDEPKSVYSPGESIRMTVAVTDENDRPVPGAVLGVSVVDDAAISLRQHDLPTIKTHFLLTSEVQSPKDLEHANFYLSESPEAAESLDLLLGTQGWRRFVSGAPDRIEESFQAALVRLLELDGERSGLLKPTQTNQPSIAAALYDYQLQARRIWEGFVAEIRAVLIIIGLLWLIGLFVRPRQPAVAASGLLLLCAVALSPVGCGNAQYAMEDVSRDETASKAEDGAEAFMMEMEEMGDMEAPNQSVSEGTRPRDSDEAEQPFVERVVRAFLGQKGSTSDVTAISRQISPDQLRQWAESRDLDAQELADRLMEELRFPIRQYAHLHRPSDDEVRRDFAETLYWNPLMVTDSTGTASIRFDLSDSQTMFRVHVDSHTSDGRLGSGGGSVRTQIPIQVEPKIPLEVSAGDRIDLPVGVINSTDLDGAVEVRVETDSVLVAEQNTHRLSIESGGRINQSIRLDVRPTASEVDSILRVTGTLGDSGLSDQVEREVRVVPVGYPFEVSQSASLSGEVQINPALPASVVQESVRGSITVYPSTRSQLSAGLESILREPHGCFEQASASNYPNVMAFHLLHLDGAVDDSDRRRTESLLRRGYRKLTSYECSTLGYEWFGNDPGHEALSAFGLMQFTEMARYVDVDKEMLERTRKWLLDRRDGAGGFQRNPRHLHQWSVRQEIVNAYVLWALSQADRAGGETERTENELARELDAVQKVAEATDDPYLIALSSITLSNVGRTQAATRLLDRLAQSQRSDGSVEGVMTVTQSGGISRTVETTSLAVLAFATSDQHQMQALAGATWLVENRRGGGFGSTQATVLALKALIVMHDQMVGDDGGSVDVLVGDQVVDTIRWTGRPADGQAWEMTPAVLKAITASESSTCRLRNQNGGTLPVSIHLVGRTTAPQSDPNCPVKIRLALQDGGAEASVEQGDTVDVTATVTNTTAKGQPMTVAVIGLPGGLEPVIERLDDLRDSGDIDYYEIRGRDVVFYWRTFAPEASKTISLPCVAEIGGRYTGPASRTYLYYTAESKSWFKPLVTNID